MNIEDVLKGHGIGGGGSNIKSVQRGSVVMTTATKDIPISAVDMNNAIVLLNFASKLGGGSVVKPLCQKGQLTSSTNLQITATDYSSNVTVYWQVVEFNNVKSVQRGILAMQNVNKDVTISSINVDKSLIYATNDTSIASSDMNYALSGGYAILNSTTLRFYSPFDSSTKNIAWQVIEFK